MTGTERKKRDKRIIRRRARGATVREIAKEERMSSYGTFLALKRLEPQLVTALKQSGLDLHKALTDVIEMTQANETRLFFIDGQIVEHQVPDNATRLRARTRLLNLHVGTDIGSMPAEQQPSQTNVMVIVGATDDRIEALRRGNGPEITSSASSNVSTSEGKAVTAEGDTVTNESADDLSDQ